MSDQPLNPGLVFDLMNSYQRSAALHAAVELGMFAALGEGHSTVPDLARRCQATERGMRILCDYLTIMGLVEKHGDSYRHSATSAAFLDPSSPNSIASAVQFMNHQQVALHFENLADIIRHGKPDQGTVEPENPVWVEFAHKMAPMMGPLAGPLGDAVLAERTGHVRVLDIAAGHGLFGIEVAKKNPEAEIVALDWAPVLEVAQANARKAGVDSRLTLKAGSAFDIDFDGPYDIILLTNFLHHFDWRTCTDLLKKCYAALNPGGLVAALEFVPNPDRITPPETASFALIMLGTTQGGDAYTFPEYEEMYLEAGFSKIHMRDIPQSPHRIVLGEVPR